ncbi:MAG: hypothetical protein U0992_18575 [Planctomycetaceae bacterium]
MSEPRKRRIVRRAAIVAAIMLSVALLVWIVDSGTRTRRAQRLTVGMSRAEVRNIMGLPNRWYTVANKAGTGVIKGDCFDSSQLNSYFERFVRPRLIGKFGYMPQFRTDSQYPFEVVYDDKEIAISIRSPEGTAQ